MVQHGSQQIFLNISSLRHTAEVCPKPCQSLKFIISSPHLSRIFRPPALSASGIHHGDTDNGLSGRLS